MPDIRVFKGTDPELKDVDVLVEGDPTEDIMIMAEPLDSSIIIMNYYLFRKNTLRTR